LGQILLLVATSVPMAVSPSCSQSCRGRSRPSSAQRKRRLFQVAAVLALVCVSALSLQQVPEAMASISLRPRNSWSKVLFTYRDYELVVRQQKAQVVPRFQLRKTPPAPVTLSLASSGVAGPVDKSLVGFPFTTDNNAAVDMHFPRISSCLKLRLQDPSAESDLEDMQRAVEACYEQSIPGIGEFAANVKTTNEWDVSFKHEVEDIGDLSGSFNSQRDWKIDLDTTYPPIHGFVPSVTYGATEDGMRFHARANGPLYKNLRGTYEIQNEPGKYSPTEFRQDATLTLSSTPPKGGIEQHTLELHGTYDRTLPKVPYRGSASYTARLKPATLKASLGDDWYRLRAQTAHAEIGASFSRNAEISRPTELELKLGKVSAVASLGRDKETVPRMRIEYAR